MTRWTPMYFNEPLCSLTDDYRRLKAHWRTTSDIYLIGATRTARPSTIASKTRSPMLAAVTGRHDLADHLDAPGRPDGPLDERPRRRPVRPPRPAAPSSPAPGGASGRVGWGGALIHENLQNVSEAPMDHLQLTESPQEEAHRKPTERLQRTVMTHISTTYLSRKSATSAETRCEVVVAAFEIPERVGPHIRGSGDVLGTRL